MHILSGCLPAISSMRACTREHCSWTTCAVPLLCEEPGRYVTWGLWLPPLRGAAPGAQLLVQQVPEAIDRIIFLDGVILRTGESFALNQIGWPAQVAPAVRLPPTRFFWQRERIRLDTTASTYRLASLMRAHRLYHSVLCKHLPPHLAVACDVSESAQPLLSLADDVPLQS